MRTKRRLDQFGAMAERIVRRAEDRSEAIIKGFRPQTSERDPATSIETASRPVVSERDKLLSAALT
jgi:predicted kinase